MPEIKVAIADDHTIFLEGLKRLLVDEGLDVVWLANDGNEVLKKMQEHQPDVILLDIQMPNLNGIEALQQIKQECPQVKVIILSMLNDKPHIERVYKLGANGYLLKNTGNEELIHAIKTVYGGGNYYSAAITTTLLESINDTSSPQSLLTKREKEVLQLIAKEYSNQEIADQLFLSVETVNSHRKNIMRKLEVKNTVGLIKYAIQHDLV